VNARACLVLPPNECTILSL